MKTAIITLESNIDRYLSYNSHHYRSCEASVIFSLSDRVYSIATDKEKKKENVGIKHGQEGWLVKFLKKLPTIMAYSTYNNRQKWEVTR